MTYSDTQPRGTLRYRLLSDALKPTDATLTDPGSWGHEYVRHLAAELGEEYTAREEAEVAEDTTDAANKQTDIPQLPGTIDDLRNLGKKCATFLLGHNAEPDAVDLLEELEIVNELTEVVDDNTFSRVCQYMLR
jgi:26S proteasome regulatory subunit N1